MRRILALIWLSLSLAIASGPAFAVPSPDCPKADSSIMADAHGGMSGTHDGMDCCAENCSPECAAVCPGTIIPSGTAAAEPAEPRLGQRAACPSTMLKSAALAATDPPPRTTFS
jgi:predicted lipoprotein with Yx(FWY)xxD motif